MTSKEALNKLKHHIDGTELKGSEILECLITITNDLELLEKYKRIMCEPILDIMKELEVLGILKNKQVNIHFDLVVKDTYEEYLVGVEGSKVILTEKEWNELKEWLNGK